MLKILLLVLFCIIIIGVVIFINGYDNVDIKEDDREKLIAVKLDNLVGMNISSVLEYSDSNDIEIEVSYQYSDTVNKDLVISQSVDEGSLVDEIEVLEIVVSLGSIDYSEYNVNELGEVPIMMYHGIKNVSDTKYIGGNVDKDGYTRTSEAFREDLEFYYNKGYRMIRLDDFVNGDIDVELGKSPIILTFDDGNENNFKVLGKDDDGSLIIDPNCAVGILEEFKKKYPDYGVTATFFVNSSLFFQEEYNEEIIKWLVDNGYDVGNHTISHVDFKSVDSNKTQKEVGGIYNILDSIIPNRYVKIVALPFGSPYSKEHSNYEYILNGNYEGIDYETKACLRVGWKANESCFDKNFDATFLKRIRAYDNNGVEFDIEMNFKLLDKSRYISDGLVDTVVIKDSDSSRVNDTNKEVITY